MNTLISENFCFEAPVLLELNHVHLALPARVVAGQEFP